MHSSNPIRCSCPEPGREFVAGRKICVPGVVQLGQAISGIRICLTIALFSRSTALASGFFSGIFAGYGGCKIDRILERILGVMFGDGLRYALNPKLAKMIAVSAKANS